MTLPFLGYGRQSIAQQDIDAVVDVLRGNYLTQGPAVERFEAALAEYVGARYAVAVANGTAALHMACLAAGLRSGDHAITQAITFVASANAAVYSGASVSATDINPVTLGMDAASLQRRLAERPDTSVVLPVHMAGLSAGLTEVATVAGNRTIIEDACHALGGRDPDGAMVGSCSHSSMACFSFHPVKSITTGEGGAITTNDPELYRALRMLRSHGTERDPSLLVDQGQGFDGNEPNPWYYEQQVLGFNYRLNDLQAALGLSQLSRISQFISRRREVAAYYDEALAASAHISAVQSGDDARQRSAHHLYIVAIDYDRIGKSRRHVMTELAKRGIGTQVHYIPVYRQPYHRDLGPASDFPAADSYYRTCLSIPMHASLTEEDAGRVVQALREVADV